MGSTQTDPRRLSTAARIASLAIANALIAQAELSHVDARVESVRRTLDRDDLVNAFLDQWKFITEKIDYVPIFHLARQVLLELPQRSEVSGALRALSDSVMEIVAERAALRHDLMGRIYHRLLLEAKYLGTFYTSVPAATLLLKMTLDPRDWKVDWSDIKSVQELRVADLACGTGTLLMAAQQAITDNYIEATSAAGKKVGSQQLRSLHKVEIEDVLYGYDVLTSAVHLTASTLAMLAPDISFKRMHLYVVPLGVQINNRPALGSIEYLLGQEVVTQVDLFGEITAGAAVAVTGKGSAASQAPLPRLDLCVMNPPFTRSVGGNLLFGSIPKTDRKEMQKRLSQILHPSSGRSHVWASSTAGLGSVFVAIAHNHIREGGRMALVLPAALVSGVAWEKTRQLFAQHYVIEMLIASHDPGQWNFSENTSLSEVLVIARKRRAGEAISDAKSICVNLWRNTTTPIDALALASAVQSTPAAEVDGNSSVSLGVASIRLGEDIRGEIIGIPWAAMRQGQWYGCAFAQTDLVRAAHFLRVGKVYLPGARDLHAIPVCALRGVGDLGPDRRDIYDGFEVSEAFSSYPGYWSHQADAVLTMEDQPNRYLHPLVQARRGRPLRRVDLLWPRAGRLMLAERLRVNTQRLVATRLPKPALSNVWWPFRLKSDNEELEKAFMVWQNSTLGLVSLLSARIPTEGAWVQFKKPLLERLLVLDVLSLDENNRKRLADAYDEYARTPLLPLSQLDQDPVRALMDGAVARALNLPSLEPLRQLLSREPIVSDRPLYR